MQQLTNTPIGPLRTHLRLLRTRQYPRRYVHTRTCILEGVGSVLCGCVWGGVRIFFEMKLQVRGESKVVVGEPSMDAASGVPEKGSKARAYLVSTLADENREQMVEQQRHLLELHQYNNSTRHIYLAQLEKHMAIARLQLQQRSNGVADDVPFPLSTVTHFELKSARKCPSALVKPMSVNKRFKLVAREDIREEIPPTSDTDVNAFSPAQPKATVSMTRIPTHEECLVVEEDFQMMKDQAKFSYNQFSSTMPSSHMYRLKTVPDTTLPEHVGHADKVKGPTQTNTRVDVEPHGVSEDGETPRAEDAAKTIDEEETLGPVEDEVQGIQNTEGNASEEGDAEGEGGNATDEGGDEVQNTLNNSAGTDELLTAEAAISAVLEEAEKAARVVWSGDKEECRGHATANKDDLESLNDSIANKLFDDDGDHSLAMSASAFAESGISIVGAEDVERLEHEVLRLHRELMKSGIFGDD